MNNTICCRNCKVDICDHFNENTIYGNCPVAVLNNKKRSVEKMKSLEHYIQVLEKFKADAEQNIENKDRAYKEFIININQAIVFSKQTLRASKNE